MRIKTIGLLLFGVILTAQAGAQTTTRDSTAVIMRARRDARVFRLKIRDFQKFMVEYFPASSDYFKPTEKQVSDKSLLNDSLYVSAFRAQAYNNSINTRPIIARHTPAFMPRNFDAASVPADSAGKMQLARFDVKKFKLGHRMVIKFKAAQWPSTSDYFKPTPQTASFAALLTDSTYVKTFRNEAFYKSVNTRAHPVGHVILLTSAAAAGFSLMVATLLLFTRHGN